MYGFAIGDGLPRDMVEIVVDDFGNEVDDTLYFLASRKGAVFTKSEKVDDGLGEYDFAYLEIDLLVLKDLYFLDPTTDANVLEDVDGDVDNGRLG